MSASKLLPLAACVTAALLLASCSSNRAPQPAVTPGQSAGISGPDDFNRPHKDGAPWWDVDVSKIQDAIPMPHYGPVKASPYVVFGKQYFPIQDARRYQAVGPASWYGTKFHGQATANGETYDLYGMTAAHKTLPLPSFARVTNLDNGESVIVRVNDRGPFHDGRVVDLSYAAAVRLGITQRGTGNVEVRALQPGESNLLAQKPSRRERRAAETAVAAASTRPVTAARATADSDIDRLVKRLPADAMPARGQPATTQGVASAVPDVAVSSLPPSAPPARSAPVAPVAVASAAPRAVAADASAASSARPSIVPDGLPGEARISPAQPSGRSSGRG